LISGWPVEGVDKEGVPTGKPSSQAPENYAYLFDQLGLRFTYNQLDSSVYLNDDHWSEEDFIRLWVEAKRQGLHTAKDTMHAMVTDVALAHSFNPVKQVIEAAGWDGDDHIGKLYATLTVDDRFRSKESDYEKYLRKWVVGIVAKLYRPGAQNLVLTLMGAQGIGKSRWFSKFALWQRAFGEGAVEPGNKDHELRHLTHVIWHIPELDYTTSKRETGALKDYLTRETISVRPAYARVARQGLSICSFCASVNAEEFLVDQTGNRRYLVIPVEKIDHKHSVNMQQVLAQAKVLLESGFAYWLDEAEIAVLNSNNEHFEMQDELVGLARKVRPGPLKMSAVEILQELGIEHPSRSDSSTFGRLLAKFGFRKQGRDYMVSNPRATSGNVALVHKSLESLKKPE
jgi:predicted P-loop ATPase